MRTIAADPKHLGARIGFTSVLHTWGSAMTHHPHVHMIVPDGGLSMDGLFLEAHERAPEQIILDLDATDDPLHGQQEGRFFHGY